MTTRDAPTTQNPHPGSGSGPGPGPGSLLDAEEHAAGPTGPRPRSRLQQLDAALRARLKALAGRPSVRWGAGMSLAAVLIGAGVYAYLESRIEPPPDYETESLDVLFKYTLLTDDFNRLPIEERLELIKQLIARLDGLSGNDSVLIAMFASLIAGEARAQLEKNVSRLAIDVFDSYALEYDATAPPAERAVFLEDKAIEFEKMLEALGGGTSDATDEERLARLRRQAKRDNEFVKSGRVSADEMLRMFDVLNNNVGEHAGGHQQVRILNLMRDMATTLRSGGGPPP